MKFPLRSSKLAFLEYQRTNQTQYIIKTIEFTNGQSIRSIRRPSCLGGAKKTVFPAEKKERRALLFSGENCHGMVSMLDPTTVVFPLETTTRWHWKSMDVSRLLFLSLTLYFFLFRILVSLSHSFFVSPSFTSSFLLYPTLHCLIPRFLYPWLTLSRPLSLQSLIAMVTLLAIPAILTYIL